MHVQKLSWRWRFGLRHLWCPALLALLLFPGDRRGRAQVPPAPRSAGCAWHDAALRAVENKAVKAVWNANLSRSQAIVHPSRAYAGVWLRDSFWTMTAVGDASLAGRALRNFAAHQRANGQVPTQFASFVRQPQYRADESTLLYLIWSEWLAQHHGWRPSHDSLNLALTYIRRQVRQGRYVSQAGSYADWFDGYHLPRADTSSYNQGLYVNALLAAERLGLIVPPAEASAAIVAYDALRDPHGGYLRFSRVQPYHDISGLTGEFVAQWLFGRPLLSDAVVAATLRTQPAYKSGFRVVANADGTYLSAGAFVISIPPGDYQNGGSWLLYDYMALATGCLHHVGGMEPQMAARLRLEFRDGPILHEYLNTNPDSPFSGGEPPFRDQFSWDTFIVQVDDLLAKRAKRAKAS